MEGCENLTIGDNISGGVTCYLCVNTSNVVRVTMQGATKCHWADGNVCNSCVISSFERASTSLAASTPHVLLPSLSEVPLRIALYVLVHSSYYLPV